MQLSSCHSLGMLLGRIPSMHEWLGGVELERGPGGKTKGSGGDREERKGLLELSVLTLLPACSHL